MGFLRCVALESGYIEGKGYLKEGDEFVVPDHVKPGSWFDVLEGTHVPRETPKRLNALERKLARRGAKPGAIYAEEKPDPGALNKAAPTRQDILLSETRLAAQDDKPARTEAIDGSGRKARFKD